MLAFALHTLSGGIVMTCLPGYAMTLAGFEQHEQSKLLLQGLGVMLLVQAVGYGVAAIWPVRNIIVIFCGLLVKCLFFVGILSSYFSGNVPFMVLISGFINDFTWIFPLLFILYRLSRPIPAHQK